VKYELPRPPLAIKLRHLVGDQFHTALAKFFARCQIVQCCDAAVRAVRNELFDFTARLLTEGLLVRCLLPPFAASANR
jgi:hypothetical protein